MVRGFWASQCDRWSFCILEVVDAYPEGEPTCFCETVQREIRCLGYKLGTNCTTYHFYC